MARFMRWLALIVGLLFISAFTILFIALAVTMGPFGGIPYSWNLLFLNAPWVAMLAAGLLLIISAARMFRRAKGSR
jgi:hypothetical protein